jgi:hypothetical protein
MSVASSVKGSPRVHCHKTIGAAEMPLADAGEILLSPQLYAAMRRCGENCYVVDIYWTGLLRGIF